MRASLTYDAGTRTLRGTQTLQATNRGDTARTEAVLRLYMNGETGSSAAVTGVQVDGVDVSYAQMKTTRRCCASRSTGPPGRRLN